MCVTQTAIDFLNINKVIKKHTNLFSLIVSTFVNGLGLRISQTSQNSIKVQIQFLFVS